MTYALVLVAGLILGAAGLWFLQRPQIQYLKDELTTAQDRLYGAWKEGAMIPTKEQVRPPEPLAKPDPLPEELFHLVMDYGSAEGQQDAEAFIRKKMALGWGPERIRDELNRLPD